MDKLLALSKAEIEKTPGAEIPVAATPDGKPKHVVPVVANIAAPKPRISVATNQAGAERRTYVFPELYAIDGTLVAREVEFGGIFGLSVVFRPIEAPEKSAFSMDLDRVHPEMLKAMGQNPRSLQQAQADREEQKRKAAEQARKSAVANLQAEVQRSLALVRSRELRAYDEALERERRIEQDLERQRREIEAMHARAASLEPPPQRYRILRPRPGAT
jgi:RecA/RadA recombinase